LIHVSYLSYWKSIVDMAYWLLDLVSCLISLASKYPPLLKIILLRFNAIAMICTVNKAFFNKKVSCTNNFLSGPFRWLNALFRCFQELNCDFKLTNTSVFCEWAWMKLFIDKIILLINALVTNKTDIVRFQRFAHHGWIW